ncbi:hypothetical protein [Achromobacter xylosoxidans]|uniref:hypothetical protein n=1 Tax=Alcaligenes xylosoxydans xylosoxydans TaxID=85698 RepID=UPI000AB5D5EC|nr:hypothetical protein [Achromobacter xylosoxidans]MCH4592672.1 hypothetical protein [Achromobacter xylosoxidans]
MICSSYERHSDPGGSTFFSNALPAARMLASTNSYTDDLKIPDASLPPNTYVHPHFFEQKSMSRPFAPGAVKRHLEHM